MAIVVALYWYFFRRSLRNSARWTNSPYRGWKKVIIAQAQHETGNFKSPVFKQLKNAFGMRLATRRPTTALGKKTTKGGNSYYAYYRSVADSLQDLFLYLDDFGFPKANTWDEVKVITKGMDPVTYYVNFISANGYFEDNYWNYLRNVQYYYKKNAEKKIEIPFI